MFKTKPGRLLQLASKSRLLIACRVATIVIQLLESVSASLRFQWENIPKRWSNSLPKCVLLFEKTEVKRVSCFAKTCHVFFFIVDKSSEMYVLVCFSRTAAADQAFSDDNMELDSDEN